MYPGVNKERSLPVNSGHYFSASNLKTYKIVTEVEVYIYTWRGCHFLRDSNFYHNGTSINNVQAKFHIFSVKKLSKFTFSSVRTFVDLALNIIHKWRSPIVLVVL